MATGTTVIFDGSGANVLSSIKRIRIKCHGCDPGFDEIENYASFGYSWRKLA